jgi:hypothetical protein
LNCNWRRGGNVGANRVKSNLRKTIAMNREFTREELYALVWSKPTRTIAKELGISDVALGKTCRKLSAPKPPPGYWAKVAHGKSPKKEVLQPAPTGTPTKAVIHEQPKDLLPKVKLVQKLPELKVSVDIEISEKLVIATQKALLRSDRDNGRLLSAKYQGNVLSASVSKAQPNRAVEILNALIKEFKQRDVSTVAENPPGRYFSAFVSKSETVMFSIRELTHRRENKKSRETRRLHFRSIRL